MNIAICLDDNYFEPSFLLINSILLTNKNEKFDFYITFEKLSDSYINKFKKLESHLIKFNFTKIEASKLKNCPIRKGDHVSLATYYRLLLSEILPEEIDKVLYLDGDMLCFDSLKDLYETNIDNCSLAASLDSQCQNEKRKQPLGMKNDTNYFGAGMLLINLKYWRENKIEEKSFEYIRINSEKLLWHDQDTLNAVLEGSTKTVDFNYNFYETFFKIKDKSEMSEILWEKVCEAKKKICILHYTQAEKPWYFECEHPLKDIYRDFYKSIFNKKLHLKFKYPGRKKISFIKRKILSKILNFKMNPNYMNFPDEIRLKMRAKLGI